MYKQTLYGFRSHIVAGIFETFLFLLYTSFIETAIGTELSSFLYYLVITLVFVLVSVYIFIGAAVKYEYALLDTELILRKYVLGKVRRIYSVTLVRTNCIYCNKGIRFVTTPASETKLLYQVGFLPFARKCAIVFTDRDGIKRKLIFKPDSQLDELIYRVKTAQW